MFAPRIQNVPLEHCNYFSVAISLQKKHTGLIVNQQWENGIVSKIKKALARIKSKPSNFTWNELTNIMLSFGYKQLEGSGSRVKFYHDQKNTLLAIHRPHNPKILRPYQIEEVINRLERDGFL